MPSGLGGNKVDPSSIKKPVTGRDDLEEINKIAEMLNPDEKVFLVARQSRIKPGGSHFTPNIIYATDRRIIVRDPYILGMIDSIIDGEDNDQGGIIEAIPKDKAEDLLEIIRSGMQDDGGGGKSAPSKKQKPSSELLESKEYTMPCNESISIADELRKLAKLKEEGLLTEEEFKQMKQDLIKKNR